jgi:hypothetical protein
MKASGHPLADCRAHFDNAFRKGIEETPRRKLQVTARPLAKDGWIGENGDDRERPSWFMPAAETLPPEGLIWTTAFAHQIVGCTVADAC